MTLKLPFLSGVRLTLALALSLLSLLSPTAPAEAAATCYVNDDAGGANTGASWTDAYTDLQSALADSSCGETWVAAGTYKPGASGERWATFNLRSGTGLYGGFAGGETARDQRDESANPTILSGDLDGSGTLTDLDAYHVVAGSGLDNTTVLDSFTIRGGNANSNDVNGPGMGGGMYLLNSSLSLSSLSVENNYATYDGGGIYAMGGSPTLHDIAFIHNTTSETFGMGGGLWSQPSGGIVLDAILFDGNYARNGGGMALKNNLATLVGANFINNSAVASGGGLYLNNASAVLNQTVFNANDANYGGGLHLFFNSSAVLTEVVFVGNTAGTGGGMYTTSNSSAVLTGVDFESNVATAGGGMYSTYSSAALTDVRFSDNTAGVDGGGMYNHYSHPTLDQVIFAGNSAYYAGGGMYNFFSNPVVANSSFSLNTAGTNGGGLYNEPTSSPTLTDLTFTSNSAGTNGGGLFLNSSSGTVARLAFNQNTAGNYGGGLFNKQSSTPLTELTFTENTAQRGAGMYNSYANPKITGAVFDANTASQYGGGLHNENSSPMLVNARFNGNTAEYYGGGMFSSSSSSPTVVSSVFAGNLAKQYNGGGSGSMYSSVEYVNVLFDQNRAAAGGAVSLYNSNDSLINVTFTGNQGVQRGGAVAGEWGGSLTIDNSILWGNTAPQEAQISPHTISLAVSYSLVQGGWSGSGNLSDDPQFVDAPGGNYRLQPLSPAFDAGDNSKVPADSADLDADGNATEATSRDLDGWARFFDHPLPDSGLGTAPLVDMGAYETPYHAPTLSAVAAQETDEDTPSGEIAFSLADLDTPLDQLNVTAQSANTSLIPNENIILAGAGASRTLAVAPAADQHGTTTITLTASDGSFSYSIEIAVTVHPVNDAPVLELIGGRLVEVGQILAFSAAASDVDGDELTFSLDAGAPAGASIDPQTGAFSFAHSSGWGPFSVTVRVSDGALEDWETFTIDVPHSRFFLPLVQR